MPPNHNYTTVRKYGNANPPGKTPLFSYGKKSLGGRRTLGGKFVCPVRNEAGADETNRAGAATGSPSSSRYSQEDRPEDEEIDERLRHIDPKMVELIRSEIMDRFTPLTWDDIAGLDYAKTIIQEAVVWPILRPDIFTGLRRPPRGILLFGPPGTGKTLIGKCIASQSKSTFFSISASSLMSLSKYGNANPPGKTPLFSYGKKSLGGRRTLGGKFVCPVRNEAGADETNRAGAATGSPSSSRYSQEDRPEDEEIDERLRHIDPKMVELIRSEIMDRFTPLTWDDIAGLDYAKTIIQEAVVWPILRPDIFTGLRRPPRGILLFGPPGTGKTLIGKCIASQSKSTFFSISASSLTSKWIGDGEKMVRALFAVASVHQPAVVFIDEIDSLLCQRSETEHESSRRLKTEFLVQLDGAATAEDERILIVGATNRPQELDEAARRRLVKRLYIPLPELPARVQILSRLLGSEKNSLSSAEISEIGQLTDGFSGADMKVLCHEASMGPIRSIPFDQLGQIGKDDVRPVCYEDFKAALGRVRASVSPNDLTQYVKWDRLYGSGASS
ncbi:hypothetical protein RP20_CCG017823 [Aedes albopictus]|nr:hypothetical protein RP20_CCG017823 [Aedes albopictus]